MTCKELVELVTDYLEDELPPAERAAFDAHLAVCAGCVHYLEQTKMTIRLVHDADELQRRPEVAGLLAAFRDWKRTRPTTG